MSPVRTPCPKSVRGDVWTDRFRSSMTSPTGTEQHGVPDSFLEGVPTTPLRPTAAPPVEARFAVFLVLVLAACTAAPDAPLDLEATAESVVRRDTSPEAIRRALGTVELPAFVVRELSNWDGPKEPSSWSTCALAFEPSVRQARRDFEALRERESSAGAPRPIGGEVDNQRFFTSRAQTALMFGVDVLGLFGVGRAAAAEDLAEARSRAAWSRLEVASFDATFDVRLALVRLGIARWRRAVHAELAERAAVAATRLGVFADHGWLPSADLAQGHGALARLERARLLASAEEAEAVAQLARVSGVPPDSPWYEALDAHVLDRLEAELPALDESPPPTQLLRRLPQLRSVQREFAVAEAELRLEVARDRWPEWSLGPQWMVMPDDVIAGGMLRLQVPFPGAQRGAIRAALVRRDRQREALEDALFEALAELHVAEAWVRQTADSARDEAQRALDAATARYVQRDSIFSVDPSALGSWAMALDQLRGEWEAYFDATSDWWNARYAAAKLRGLEGEEEARP